MGGTRFNNRGIDETGASANFVETEQIIISKEHLYSFIQIRGSIPLFWKQNPTNHQISLSKNVDMCYPYFKKHIKSLQSDYNKIMLVNLLSNHKEGESQLSRILERLISSFNTESHSEHLSKVLYALYDIKAHSNNEVYR
jgi:synaptojanin